MHPTVRGGSCYPGQSTMAKFLVTTPYPDPDEMARRYGIPAKEPAEMKERVRASIARERLKQKPAVPKASSRKAAK